MCLCIKVIKKDKKMVIEQKHTKKKKRSPDAGVFFHKHPLTPERRIVSTIVAHCDTIVVSVARTCMRS